MKTSPPIDVGMLTGHRLNSMRISEENEVKKKIKAQPSIFKWLPTLMLTLLFLAGSSWSVMGQTITSTPTPAPLPDGKVYICVDGTITLHVDNSVNGVDYTFNKSGGPGGAWTEGPIVGNGGRISSSPINIFDTETPPIYIIGAVSLSPFWAGNLNVDVTAKPTAPTLTLSQPEGSVNANSVTSISAILATAGSGGVAGTDPGYEYSTDGGGTWEPYSLGTNIATTMYQIPSIKIKAFMAHPDGLGCYAENIYTWTINSRVHNSATGSYYNIQDAINNASDGHTILVDAGTYIENASTSTGDHSGIQLTFIGETDMSGAPISIIEGSLFLNDNDGKAISNIRFKSDGVTNNHLLQLKNTNGLTITNCIFDGDGNLTEQVNGINHISGSNGNSAILVEDCKFIGSLYVGISSRFTGLTVRNTLFDDIKSGINHQSANGVDVEDCIFNLLGTDSYGVRFSSTDVALNLSISNCYFNLPLTGGNTAIWMRSGAGGTMKIEHNSIIGQVGMLNQASINVDAKCNWWGSANEQTIAQIVIGNIDYINYLVTNNLTTPDCSGSPVEIDAITTTDEICGTAGSIKVVWSGGSEDYIVAWAGPVPGSQANISGSEYTIENLTEGEYTITVTDVYGSSITAIQSVGKNQNPPVITPITAAPLTCTTTSVDVTVTASGSNLSYAWSGGTPANAQTNTFTAAGTYTVTVTDGDNGCSATANVTIQYLPVTNVTQNTHHATIAAAITAATVGDLVEVCAGTYTETFNLNKNITLRGPNYDKHGTDNTRVAEAILNNSAINVSAGILEGFRLNWSNNPATTAVTVANGVLTIRNNYFYKANGTTNVAAFQVHAGANARTIEGNYFNSQASGTQRWRNSMWLNANATTVVNLINNRFERMQTAINFEGFGPGINVQENEFMSSNTTQIAFGAPPVGNYSFGKNYIASVSTVANCSGCPTGFRLDMTQSVIDGTDMVDATIDQLFTLEQALYHLGRNSSGARNGFFMFKENSLFVRMSTIQNGVIHALSGDTIFVYNANWTEKVTVNKDNLTFYGRRYADPVNGRSNPAAGTETRMAPTAGNDIAFTTSGTINNLTIKGFSFQGGSGGSSRQGIVPAGVVTNLVVENNLFNTFNNAAKESFKPYEGSQNVTFSENRYFSSQKGPHYPNGVSGSIQNNMIPGVASGVAVTLGGSDNNVEISNNDMSGVGTAVQILNAGGTDNLGTTSVHDNNVSGKNTYFNNARSVALLNYCNWFGETDLVSINSKVTGNANVNSYLTIGNNNTLVGFEPDAGVCSYPVNNTSLVTGHLTIQDAIDNADPGNTIEVNSGTYAEDLTIDKSISLLGPNVGVGACGTRADEAIIMPATSMRDAVIDITASDITIDGFTINGDNPDVVTGYPGATPAIDPDVYDGISRYAPGNNLVIQNNIVKNTAYTGITLYDYPAGNASAGNIVSNNKIQDLGTYDAGWAPYNNYGIGVLIHENQYTQITENCMDNVRIGVQTGNFSKANPGLAQYQQIKDNVISARRTGIMHNLHYSNASELFIDGNEITALDNSNETKWDGIFYGSLSVAATGSGNTIDGAGLTKSNKTSGYNVWNVKTPISNAKIIGGTITGVDYGIFANNFEGYNSNGGDGAHVTISGVTITTNEEGIGVYALDSDQSTTHGNVIVSVTDCTIDGGYQGITLNENEPGTVGGTLTKNTIEADWAGINIYEGMVVSATNPLVIEENNITMTGQIAPNDLPSGGIVLRGLSGDAPTVKDNNITGAFGGIGVYGVNTTPTTVIEGGNISGTMQGVVVVNLDPVTFSDRASSTVHIKDIIMTDFFGDHGGPYEDANFHAGVYATSGGSDASATVVVTTENLNISGTGNHSPASAAYIVADWSGLAGMLNVTINESNIHDNLNRGIYTRGEGANVAVNRSTFTNNGFDPHGTGFNDGYGIAVREGATLTALNNFITNPATVAGGYDVYALFTDGAGAGTATLTAHDNWLSNNGNANGKLAFNLGDNGVWDASCNWWGAGLCMNDVNYFVGTINNTPHLTNGTDDDLVTTGFQPVTGACDADPVVITSATVSNQTCSSLGSVVVVFSGGESPYTIDWGIDDATDVSPFTINGLAAGTYTITVTDKCGNSDETTVTITNLPVANTTQTTYFATIQSALNAAVSGDVIEVCAGTYTENVVISEDVTLRGPNYNKKGNDGTRVPEAIIVGNVTVNHVGVTFEGFNVQSGGSLRAIDMTIGAGSLIQNNIIDGLTTSTNSAIWYGGATGVTNIEGNLIRNFTTAGWKIFFDGGSTSEIYFTENELSNMNSGIIFSGSMENSIGEVKNNILSANTWPVVALGASSKLISGNMITNGGIWIEGHATLSNRGNNNEITNNTFTGSGYYVTFDNKPHTGNKVNENAFLRAVASKVNNGHATSSIDASCNWWGGEAESDVLIRITGVGAANVGYTNWLVDGTDDSADMGFQPVAGSCLGEPVEFTLTPTAQICSALGAIEVNITSGVANYDIEWTGVTNGSALGVTTSPYTIADLAAGTYSVTITDTYGSTGIESVTVGYNPVHNVTRNTHHATIQAAIDAGTTINGDVIEVCAGTYTESIYINKEVKLYGANVGKAGNDGSRGAETIILTDGAETELVVVDANNVVFDGFVVDGTTVGGNVLTNTSINSQIEYGVYAYNSGNFKFENNIVRNIRNFGTYFYSDGADHSTESTVRNNYIYNVGSEVAPKFGVGVILNAAYVNVTENVMDNVRIGIQTDGFKKPNTGAAIYQSIDNNTISNRRIGIFNNVMIDASSALSISENTITGLAVNNAGLGHTLEGGWDGIVMSILRVSGTTATNNIISGGTQNATGSDVAGYKVWSASGSTAPTISGGTVSGVTKGVFISNYAGYGGDGPNYQYGSGATVSNVTFSNVSTGVDVVYDSSKNNKVAKIYVNLSNSGITASEYGVNIHSDVAGRVSGSVTGSSITAGSNGIYVDNASSTDGVNITNNTVSVTNKEVASVPTMGIALRNVAGTAAATVSGNTVSGAFYGYGAYDVNTTPVTTISGGTVTGIMQGLAILNTLDAGTTKAGTNLAVDGVSMSGFTGSSTNPAINFHAGIYTFTTSGTTAAQGINLAVNNVTINGTGKPSQASGGIYLADFSGGSDMVQTVTVNVSNIINNANRGVDARGKVDLTLTANTMNDNGHDAFGTGGNNGYTIIAQQNSKVTATNNFINLPATSTTPVYGLGLGNGSTNLITAHDNSILLNGNTDPSSRLAYNPGTGTIDATCNWWGTGVCAGDVAYIQGVVGVYPFLTSGVDSDGATGFQPVAGACNEPSITGSVTGPSGTISMVSGNSYTMAICSGQEVTPGLAGVVNSEAANCASLRVQTVYTTTISTLPPTQTIDVPFSVASTIPQPAITPENHDGVAKDIVFVSRPYYDVNGNGVYDAGVDVAGGLITFTLTVQPMPIISNTVTAIDGYNQTMTSGGTYAHTICHDVDMTTSVPTLVTNPRATECGVLRINTQYISTLPNIPSNTIDVTFDQAVAGGSQTISPENHTGTPQTITFITTPYYDVNGNNVYDAGVDIVGDVTTFVLTVQPKPELTCPSDIATTNDAGLCSAVVTYAAPTFTDYCPTTLIEQTLGLSSGSAFPVGVTTNTFVITDGSGHTSTCSFTVTVVDNKFPTYTIPVSGGSIAGYECGDMFTFSTDASSCNSLQTIAKPIWADNCGITSVTAVTDPVLVVQDFGFYQINFPTGTTVLTMKASDAAGNETSCSLTFTVTDQVPPILQNMPVDVTITAPYGDCTMNYSWTPPTGWDNCSGSVTISSSHTPPFAFAVGATTTVTYTATDGSGNTASASFDVTVDGFCIPAVELTTSTNIPIGGLEFTTNDDELVEITVENIGANDSHELLPIGNVKVLVGYPSTNIFTSNFDVSVGDNDDWDVTNYGTGMALFTLKTGKVIQAGGSKTITIKFTAEGFAGQNGKVTAHLYTGSGGDVNKSNNYTDGELKIN